MNVKTRSLLRYILPALGGLFVTYLYNVVDGIFVGRGVGSAALGAVNLAVPYITTVVALTALFPMGGATVAAIRMGRGDSEGANQAFLTALSLTLLLSAIFMAVGMAFPQRITDLCGGRSLSQDTRTMAAQYLFYYSAFSIPMLLGSCLSVFVRNDGSPALSFLGMCAGAAANIFLDWLFLFPLRMGAAVASGLGQVLTVLLLLTHFLRKKGELRIRPFPLRWALVKKVCRRGLPEAVTQLTTPVTALCYNLALARLVGNIGVSTFSVLSFLASLATAILSGVAQGLQPLWGQCYGRRDSASIVWYFRRGLAVNAALSALILAALRLFALSFLPMALNLVFTAYFFSTKRTGAANAIALSRGIVLKALMIFALPALLGVQAIWLAPFVSELLTLLAAAALQKAAPLRLPS